MAIAMTGYFLFDSDFVEPLAAWQTHTIPGPSQPATQNATPIQQVRGTLSASDYLQALHNLLPYGPAWTDDPNAVISKLLDGLSQELARIDGRCWALIDEADPRSASELFFEWQSQFGLPDPCVVALGGNQSGAQRRSALLSKITNVGGTSIAYYIAVAKTLGYTISITEFMGTDMPLRWQVNVSIANSLTRFTFTTDFSEPLASWGSVLLECTLKRIAPAHTDLVFSYT